MDTPEGIRVQKFLSQAGVSSRRKAEELMRAGRVAVNGKPATELGLRIVPGRDRVEVDGRVINPPDEWVYIAVYKPKGMITSLSDPEGRPVITDLLPENAPRVWPVGRLDWDSEGLVLMTNDGKLTHRVTHPSHHVEKNYIVKLRGFIASKDPGLERMRQPITLDDGFVTSGAEVIKLNNTDRNTWVQVTIHEGHNRQIRRMAEAAGYTVLRLRRTTIGPLELGELEPGRWRRLYPDEIASLYKAVEAKPPTLARKPRSKPRSRNKPSKNRQK